MIIKLVTKGLIQDKIRFTLAVFGVAASTGLIIWSLGLTETTAHQSREKVRRMTEPYNIWIATSPIGKNPTRRTRGAATRPSERQLKSTLPDELVRRVKTAEMVELVEPFKVVNATLDYRPDGRVMQGPPLVAGIVHAKNSGCPYAEAKVDGRWPDPHSAELEAAVCSAIFTPRRLAPPEIGSDLVLITATGALTVKITAIVDYPESIPGFPTVFTTAGAMRQLYKDEKIVLEPDLLLCRVNPGSEGKFLKQISESMPSEFATSYHIAGRSDVEKRHISDKQRNFKRQAPLLLTLSILTALCMMMNALTIGVRQRLRSLALLRSAGMTRSQVTAVIIAEGFLVAFLGWLFGSLGGWAILKLFVKSAPETFPSGAALGWLSLLQVGIGVTLTMLLSLCWPCRRVMLIRPLDALNEQAHEQYQIKPIKTLLGAIMMFPMLALALPLDISPMSRSIIMLMVGIPIHIIGMIFVLPAFIRVTEMIFVPAIARVLKLDSSLIRHRLSGNITQTTGMVLTLAVGLGTFTAIHIWGSSLTKPFLPSQEFPDVIVSILPGGVPRDSVAEISTLPGVAHGKCVPIEVLQLPLAPESKDENKRAEIFKNAQNALLFGVNPEIAFGGAPETALAPFRFSQGARRTAVTKLQDGRHCLITKMYSRASGLGVGDTLYLSKPHFSSDNPKNRKTPDVQSKLRIEDSTLSLKIAGVVDLNWHLVTSRAHLRGRNGMPGFTTGPVFVAESVVREVSGNPNITYFLWTNLSDEYRALGALAGGSKLESDIRQKLSISTDSTVRVHHRDEIEDGTVSHSADLLNDMARAPFWSLIVLSTGIITLLIASYHATARETAVMRAIGLTRDQLGRILFSEALLVAICGIIFSIICGFCIGWTFTGWTRAWMPFEGLPVSLSIPWRTILKGTSFAFFLCAIMAFPPIFYLVRKNPT